jgi:DNA-directed RNA polymerase subunit RPC12/RpoP
MTELKCPRCSHTDAFAGNPADAVVRCDECGQRIAHGVPIARVTTLRHPDDPRFVTLDVESLVPGKEAAFQINVDRAMALELAEQLIVAAR